MPAFSRTPRRRGRRDPAHRRRPRDARGPRLADAGAAPASRRPARPAGGQPGRRAPPRRALRAPRRARTLRAGMAEILAYSERRTRAALAELPDGSYRAEDVLEGDWDGEERDLRLRLEATIAGRLPAARLRRQRGAGRGQPQLPPLGDQIRRLLRRPRPHRPRRPALGRRPPADRGGGAPRARCSTPATPAAVAAGNVETSSRVADLVLAALSQARPGPAQGQGTMNNLTLAGEGFTYYETLGGGQGACPDADGPSAIHVAMSNTLNTPTEALEAGIPPAGARALAAPGQRRRGPPPRRRRARPRDRSAGADAVLADYRASAAPAAGAGRAAEDGAAGRQPPQRGAAAEQDGGRSAPGRPPPSRNSGRRRVELGHISQISRFFS